MRVLSFDFDGCLFNLDYFNYCRPRSNNGPEYSAVINYNQKFLDILRDENTHFAYSKVISFVGSNRQSKNIDDANSIKYDRSRTIKVGSCFPAIREITSYLKVKLDTFLLADIYGKNDDGEPLKDGTSFNRAIDPTFKGKHADWVFDETKATILYAQMHKIATANPDEEIVFDFYDDRSDIIYSLNTFFEAHKELIPQNVTLRLNKYENAQPSQLFSEIVGSGIIDANYRETVQEMAQISLDGESPDFTQIKVTAQLDPSLLTNRKALSLAPINISNPVDTNAPLNRSESAFFEILKKIDEKTILLRNDGHTTAADKAENLTQRIRSNFNDYKSKEIDLDRFKAFCKADIHDAHKLLDEHRGFKKLLVNLAWAIGTLGLGHLALSIVTGNFTLFHPKTKSQGKLDILESALNKIKLDDVTEPATATVAAII